MATLVARKGTKAITCDAGRFVFDADGKLTEPATLTVEQAAFFKINGPALGVTVNVEGTQKASKATPAEPVEPEPRTQEEAPAAPVTQEDGEAPAGPAPAPATKGGKKK